MRQPRKAFAIVAASCAGIGAAAYAVLQLPAFGGRFDGVRLERMRRSPEFIGGRFENTPRPKMNMALIENIRLYSQGQVREPRFEVPVIPLDPRALSVPPSRELEAIWFGHSTVMLEMDGVRIMTDPVLSDVASPLPPLGPHRLHRAPIALRDLTGIDAVVISHDHYDHLDMKTVQHLASRGTDFFVPLGVGAHLERWGVRAAKIHEMDWWDSTSFKGIEIDCTPARHYSGRKRMDNSTLWASWAIRGSRSVYFSGDSGYSAHFREIRKRLGAMDLTLMKIGAYGDTWLDIHMDPESAIKAHLDLGGRMFLPVHWATFNLSYHAWDEPILRTLSAAKVSGVDVVTPRVGERVALGRPFRNVAWYEH